jgi:hemoglobin
MIHNDVLNETDEVDFSEHDVTNTAQRHDIDTREDIEILVETFYSRAMADPVLGPIFTDVARMDLVAHMPVMCDFWENILFQARKYPGGMMMVHFQLHMKTALAPHHFQRWLDYWEETVDALFAGERANVAKVHAGRVAVSMSRRFEEVPGGTPIATMP